MMFPPLRDEVRSLGSGSYAQKELPLFEYAALAILYGAAVTALLVGARKQESALPERVAPEDIVLLGAATHKATRLLAKDRITSPLRAAFTEYQGSAAGGEVSETSRGHGLRRAVGDLISCPFCLGPWVAAGLTCAFVFSPRVTRVVAAGLTVIGISDFLHQAYEAAKKKAS
jgi:hypothetical protein